ncbi:MAG: PilN domain-containing protein [Deltaproteobacteria bacterium]|nr:PilN domain-containing protein [Deltaproteobacteria bacterium]MBW2075800.1 PilN domain-containing protein [Deltaproteobacteria bacterium]RLB81343.1 MAG: hypothetical protein DRH17_09345 [Deltaproteobacteria bacterium]
MIRINLLPVRAARKKENVRRQVSIFFLSVFLVIVVMAYVAFDLSRNISDLNVKIEDAQNELTKLQAISRQVKEIKEKLKNLQAKMDIIEKLEANRTGPVRIMDALTTLVVAEKMWLTNLTETGGRMSLSGVAMDNKTIADFMKRLEGSPYFNAVDLIASRQIFRGQGRKFKGFTITCQTSTPKPSKEPQAS